MQDNKQITPKTLRLIAAKLQAISDPSRLSLLNELREGEKNVSSLVHATRMGQANVSKHLRVLREHRLVDFRKVGLQAYYRILDPVVFKLCNLLCNALRAELEQQSKPHRKDSGSKKKLPPKALSKSSRKHQSR